MNPVFGLVYHLHKANCFGNLHCLAWKLALSHFNVDNVVGKTKLTARRQENCPKICVQVKYKDFCLDLLSVLTRGSLLIFDIFCEQQLSKHHVIANYENMNGKPTKKVCVTFSNVS